MKRLTVLAATAAATLGLSGCSFNGINSIALPLGHGGGRDDLRITVELANAANLVNNSEVRYRDVVVGSVRHIELSGWHAKLTLGIDHDAHLPADVTATIGQKSLLGAEYLQLEPARTDGSRADAGSSRELASGATIGLDRTSRYPETEEVLSAAALLLNNGGLPQIHNITTELNAAFDGRTEDVKSLISTVGTLTHRLDTQRGSIVEALTQVNRLAKTVNDQSGAVDDALHALPQGIATLQRERTHLVQMLDSLDDFSAIAHRVVSETADPLARNLSDLRAVTKQLADHADGLTEAINDVSFPFPIKAINNAFFGDYINFFADVDLNLSDMATYWTAGTPLQSLVSLVLGVPATAASSADPLATLLPKTGAQTSPQATTSAAPHTQRPSLAGPGAAASPSPSATAAPQLSLDALVGSLLSGGSRR